MPAAIDRPIFIMAAPRSGSTLLFETLQQSSEIWTLDDEGHALIEQHAALRPGPEGVDSNRLDADKLTPALAAAIRSELQAKVVNVKGQPLDNERTFRLLEKTPKNILRIPFLNALFPDALFIYLLRDPLPNIASIIEGWNSGRFVTYSNIQTRYGPWSFLLPPGWQQAHIANLAEAAAWQWAQSHHYAMQDLAQIERERWLAINYDELLNAPTETVLRLCQFADISFDTSLEQRCAAQLPLSRYTLDKPAADKWQKHRAALTPVLASLQAPLAAINTFIGKDTTLLNTRMPTATSNPASQSTAAPSTAAPAPAASTPQADAPISRNASCPCGSGQKYKRCCGALN